MLGIQHGSVSADKSSAQAGETITLTATPADNYEFKSFIVKDASGTAITVTNGKFTMPKSNVTVSAVFESPLSTPLTLEAIADGTISVSNPWSTLQYTQNDEAITPYSGTITVAAGDKVSFYAQESGTDNYTVMTISCSSDTYIYGNIMSLVSLEEGATAASQWNPGESSITTTYAFSFLFYGNTHIKNHASKKLYLPATTLANYSYRSMFSGCTALTTAPDLPATELADGCYDSMFSECIRLTTAPGLAATELTATCYQKMFSGCTALTAAPDLPAVELASSCYSSMFRECTSLTTAPELPASKLADYCYSSMFNGCTSLMTAPALPATELAGSCYYGMFDGCTSLTSAPELPATTLTIHCYNQMFQGCTSLTAAPDLPAEKLVNYCYSRMFKGCTNLSSIKCLATDISASSCTNYWLEEVAASGTFIKAAGMSYSDWLHGANGIPYNWTVQDAQ